MHHLHHMLHFFFYSYNKHSLSTSRGERGERGPRGERGLESTERGPRGIAGETGNTGDTGLAGKDADDGATGEAGEDGATGPQGDTGPRGYTGPQGTNAGQNPSFESVDVGTLDFENSLKNNDNKILRCTGIQLNNSWRDIGGIGTKFTGIVVITALGNNLSCGTFAVSNSRDGQGGGYVKALSVQGDYSDSNKFVGLAYVGGELKATKANEGMYQRYAVCFFGYH